MNIHRDFDFDFDLDLDLCMYVHLLRVLDLHILSTLMSPSLSILS